MTKDVHTVVVLDTGLPSVLNLKVCSKRKLEIYLEGIFWLNLLQIIKLFADYSMLLLLLSMICTHVLVNVK